MFEYELEIEREVLDQKVGSDLFCRGACQASAVSSGRASCGAFADRSLSSFANVFFHVDGNMAHVFEVQRKYAEAVA